jgi:hypothetical protein
MLARLVLTLLLVAVARPVWAQDEPSAPQPSLRAIVRVAGDDDADVLERLRGHVSDLAVDLLVVKGELEPSERKRRSAAARLARTDETHARAVVWFTPLKKGGFRVHVADVERKQLLERDVEPDKGKLDRSALLETAALVVRSAFFAMLEGTDIGPPEQFTDEEQPLVLTPRPPPPPPPPHEPLALPQLAAGGEWAYDHASTRGHPGLLLRASLARGDYAVELGLQLPLPAEIHGQYADVTLWRIPLFLGLEGKLWRPSPGVALALAVRGSFIVYDRTTDAVFGGATATPGVTTVAGGVGPEIRLQFRLARRLGVELTAGADFVANAPVLEYRQGNEALQFASLWLVQPHVGLNLLFR